ncbi:hypothetical protein D9615_008769 [Tricholomella constricta]|uniref:Uncharacterized protein n=1 Tax=Tricholomella constricta TaxID=117010 RepID=A0A8H5M2C4_9AGAR|nr:hypothetical protein D9615_008769 [Tricholomella constricta]
MFFYEMVKTENFVINETHPLASELSSLRAADEAYSSSVKLQRQSLEAANAHDRVVHLERANELLRSELAVLRAHPHPDASPQAHPAALQVQQLTLSLRRLSDKLSLAEEALLERTTELAHATEEAAKAKLTADSAYELAARTRGREEAGKLRELELEWKVKAAEEAVKMSDLVVNEYADLVRSLASKAGAGSTSDLQSSSPALLDGRVQNGGAKLMDSLSEGKLGLQRLLSEFSAETEKLQKGLLQAQTELAVSEAKRDAETKNTEQCRVELAQAQFELQQLKIDDNAAAKMVSRYMKFSQKSTDTLQDAMTALKTRHTATVDTLSAQLLELSSRLQFVESQSEKLRQALDELGGEMAKEAYCRRREVALRIRMVNREEKLREELERWVLRAEEALERKNAEPQGVQDRMILDARAILSDTLGGSSSTSSGSVARLITAQNAVESLTAELELETTRRLELEKLLADTVIKAPDDLTAVNGDATAHFKPLSRPLPASYESPTLHAVVPSESPPSVPLAVDAKDLEESKPWPKDELPIRPDVLAPDLAPALDAIADGDHTSTAGKTSPNGIPHRPPQLSINMTSPDTFLPEGGEEMPGASSSPLVDAPNGTPVTLSGMPTDAPLAQTPIDESSPPVATVQLVGPGLDTEPSRPSPGSDVIPSAAEREVNSSTVVEQVLPDAEPPLEDDQKTEESVRLDHEAAHSLPAETQDETQQLEPVSVPGGKPPSSSTSPVLAQNVKPSSHAPLVAIHLEIPQPLSHRLLAELTKAKHRYDELQRALRDCHLALETLSGSVSAPLDSKPTSGIVPPEVLRTALQRLNDYTEDARVELEIRVADEALVARGYETLLSIPGALSSSASATPSFEEDDSLSHSDVERQVEDFVSGADPSVDKALRSLTRKLEDIQHDIAALKRFVHDEVVSPSSPPLTGPSTARSGSGGSGWASWIRSSPASPASSSRSGLGSANGPAPTFGNVMTTPRLRHSPSLNFQGRRVPSSGNSSQAAKDPFASLGLRIPMPSFVQHTSAQRPQIRSRTLSTMYMLGLGARRPTGPLASVSSLKEKNGPPPSLRMGDPGAEAQVEGDAGTDDDDESDVE